MMLTRTKQHLILFSAFGYRHFHDDGRATAEHDRLHLLINNVAAQGSVQFTDVRHRFAIQGQQNVSQLKAGLFRR